MHNIIRIPVPLCFQEVARPQDLGKDVAYANQFCVSRTLRVQFLSSESAVYNPLSKGHGRICVTLHVRMNGWGASTHHFTI